MELVDADVLIDVLRGHPPAVAWFTALTTMPSVPGLVVMELVQNSHNSTQVRQALQLVRPLPVVWPTEAECQRALATFMSYHPSHRLGLLDSLIAASAVGRSASLLTFNAKYFRMVPGLTLREPYTR